MALKNMKIPHLYIINILLFSILTNANAFSKENQSNSKKNNEVKSKQQLDQLHLFKHLDQLDFIHIPTAKGMNSVVKSPSSKKGNIKKELTISRQENEKLKKQIDLMLAEVKQQQQEIAEQERQNASLLTSVKSKN